MAPWFIIGDFNEISGNHEKRGGKLRHASSFLAFNGMIRTCGFIEFPHIGDWLSWRGWRDKKPIRCRLDRALGNEDWHDIFSHTVTEYLAMIGSDHKPLLSTMVKKVGSRKKAFIFDKRWIGKEGLKEAIEDGWKRSGYQENLTFMDKVGNCRNALSRWRKLQVPFGRDLIEDLKSKLAVAQGDDGSDPELIHDLSMRLRTAYQEEEVYWQQKSRNRWMRVGNRNSKFFHAQTKNRRARNRIIGLYNKDDVWHTEERDLYLIASDYFSDLFKSSNPQEIEDALGNLSTVISEDVNTQLTRPVTEKEIRDALFMMHPDKVPGPDGMTALFFQQAWEVIKKDMFGLVNSFMQEGIFDRRLSKTNICLIPKVERPTRMSELRPISLCNVGYKIISKVLCQRLKTVVPNIISETQSAFVAGRLISDNILIAQEMFHGLRTNASCKTTFMAIKTDMSKAYDRVEWVFIERLLRKLGFADKWITWVMFCVTSVEYSVLLNGQPHGSINPERGLRQGDPLSPYLFILCTEVLISNIRKAEQEKLITGIKVANKCPPISHLLFADDSLFFCKTTREQCETILRMLKKYEMASGQQINFAKSSIQFGHKVEESIRREMQGIMGITNLGGMGSYLGLPESLGGAKTRVFSFVRDKLDNHINGWSTKLLSKGGKEIMIKSVASALPTYVMSCFRLPKSVTSKLTSAVAKYWWSTNGHSGGMHWRAWERMCSSKSLGGLGFRDINDFNTALLAKQLWRLMEYPESLFAKVFKSRYYRNSGPMDPIRSYSPSYGWRSIISARSLVNRGLIKRVGTGDTIAVWRDPWIPAQFPRPAMCNGSFMDPSLQLRHFIDFHSGSWRIEALKDVFVPSDVELISALPIGQTKTVDAVGWHFTKSGKYSVKSGYYVARMPDPKCTIAPVYGPDILRLLTRIWKVRCPPKIQHFMWQLLTGCISVSANLNRRGIHCDILCSRCGAQEETVNHAIFECSPARQSWALAQVPVGPTHFPTTSIYANMDYLQVLSNSDARFDFYPWLLWYIWKARNGKMFENIDKCPLEVTKLAKVEAMAWSEAQEEGQREVVEAQGAGRCITGRPTIFAPISFGYRCFIDGSWKDTDKFTGIGWFCQQAHDGSRFLGASNLRRSLSPLHSEVEALVWAMRCMIGHDFRDVVFLTDCSDLVKMVSSPSEWPAFSVYLNDIQADREEFSTFSLSLIPRSANDVADNLARRVRVLPHAAKFVNNCPLHWLS
ncbi:uncharacterized protein LOC111832631 [Capsella rubella]|uniref:uncharacterized protein LOC111832631 n=1 Tax=Capsella rubella TaxID=81985 RepID=UPI000CD5478D|nr:uncharacterized protein LOC111832631 [Capsella rubella]